MSSKAMGGNPTGQQGGKTAGKEAPGERLDEFDLADELKGRNSLMARDARDGTSQRQAQAGATGETDGLIESFEKLDKTKRGGKPDSSDRDDEPAGESDK